MYVCDKVIVLKDLTVSRFSIFFITAKPFDEFYEESKKWIKENKLLPNKRSKDDQ